MKNTDAGVTRSVETVDLALMQQAMAHAVEGASRIDVDGRYTYVNDRYAEIAGRKPEEMLGQLWAITVCPDDLPMLEAAYAEMLETGKVTREARGVKPDGSIFYKRVTMVSEHDEDGAFVGHFCFSQDITPNREASEQHRRKEDWLELTEKIGKIGHWFVDLSEETVFWSDEVFQIHGVDPRENAPSLPDAISFYHPEDREYVANCVNRAIELQEQFDFEKRIVRPDGSTRWIASRGECRPGPDGKPAAIFGIFRDITEDRESELFRARVWQILTEQGTPISHKIQSVLEETSRYFGSENALLACTQNGSYRIDYSAYPKPGTEPGTDYPLENTYCWHVVQHDDVQSYHDVENSELKHHACYENFGLRSYIGAPLIVNEQPYGALSFSSALPRSREFSSRDRELILLIATWLGNEVGRQQVLDELAVSEQRFALAVSGSGVGIADWQDLSEDGQFWSDQHYRLLGYEPGEVTGSASLFVDHLHPEDRDEVVQVIRDHLQSGARYEKEARIRLKDGSYRWFMGTGQAVWNSSGKPIRFIGTILDIHERKSAETAKSEFVSTVSHELRTPLTSILGVLGLVNTGRYGELSERGSELLTLAQNSSERLVRLINDLLDIEKVESGNIEMSREAVPIVSLIKDAVTQFASCESNAAIDIKLKDDVKDVQCEVDPDRIIQVLTNLLSNAAKFSPSDGRIVIDVSAPESDLLISVIDQGPGVPDDQHERIFERFTQVDASDTRGEGGTGLGLAITKAIVQGHDGEIWVENHPDGGAVFSVKLPRLNVITTDQEPKASKGNALPRILYVEDDDNTAFLVQHVFEGIAEIIPAKTRAEADILLSNDDYNLILLDLHLPDQSGETLLDHIAASQKNTPPVIVYSVVDYEPQNRWDFVRGSYVKSQIDMDDLRDCIVAEIEVTTTSSVQESEAVTWPN